MSKNGTAFELHHVAIEGADDTANSAKQGLSNQVQDSMRESRSAGKAAADVATGGAIGGANVIGERAADSINKVGGGVAGEVAKEMSQGMAGRNEIINHKLERSLKPFVTDKDRENAKKALAKEIGDDVPEADRKKVQDLQGALVDGDLGKVQEALKAMSDDPAKLAKYVDMVNKQFNDNERGRGGLEMVTDSKGNVLVYAERAQVAVQIDPKTGETTVRGIDQQPDGSVVLKEGEVINRNATDLMKRIGYEATLSVSQGLDRLPFHPVPRWRDMKPTMPNALQNELK
jgi:hypothetical protein